MGNETFVRLFVGQDDSRTLEEEALIAAEPRLAWRLRDFLENWVLDGVLIPRRRAQATIDSYDYSLRYWEDVTDDPTLATLALDRDDRTCIDFVGLLPEWAYSRRGMRRGEPNRIGRFSAHPAYTPLKPMTVRTHASRIATLLQLAGPRYSPRQRVAELLPRLPYVPPVEADFEPKPPFTLDVARTIAAAARQMDRPLLPDWISHELWWQTRLALFYYTGLRAGTIVALRWSHLEERKSGLWLKVPKTIVRKTRKPIELAVHLQLAELLARVRSARSSAGLSAEPDDLILPPGCGYRHFLTLHTELQARAGVAEAERQSPHAWRRTHLSQIGELGAGRGLEFARVAADHSDGRTTEDSYVTMLVNQCRLRLPCLFS